MNRVKIIREEKRIEMETLAACVGVSPRLLRALETEKSVATVDVAFKLADALNVPIGALFGSESDDNKSKKNRNNVGKSDGSPLFDFVLNSEKSKTKEKGVQKKCPSNTSFPLIFPAGDRSETLLAEQIPLNLPNPEQNELEPSDDSNLSRDELATSPGTLNDPTVGRPIRFFDLFCGIGGFRFAMERTLNKMRREGVCSMSCDFDSAAQKSYCANFGDAPVGDVAALPSEKIPDFDLLFAGFPCQAFSIIGLRKGFADETKGSLFFEIARILRDKRPRAFVLENVRQLTTHDGGRTFETILRILREELNYCVDWKILNALDCGLPQKRERVAIVGATEPFEISWPDKAKFGKTLADVLENDADVDRKHFASSEIVRRRKAAHSSAFFPAIWHENKSGHISSYPFSCALRAGASYNYLLVNGERRLTPREMLRLQGFPEKFKIEVSDSQIRKQAGNAAPVNLIERVLDRFLPLIFASGDEK